MRAMGEASDGLTWRAITDDDLDAVVAVVDAVTAADGLEERLSTEELLERIDGPGADRATDSRVVVGPDGGVRAWGVVETYGSSDTFDRVEVWGGVDPAHRGTGIGRDLLAWQVARAEEVHRAHLADRPDRPGVAEASVPVGATATERLLARAGFTAVRWWASLGQPLTDAAAVAAPELDGVAFVPLAEVDPEAVRRAFNAAWVDHWGARQFDAHRWEVEMMGSSVLRVDLSRVAVADGEVVALLLTDRYPQDDEVRGHAEAWVGTLGTVPAWRGRGLASALVRRALQDYRAEGLGHAMIGVDTDSPTGADALYRRLGFVEERRVASWTKPLD